MVGWSITTGLRDRELLLMRADPAITLGQLKDFGLFALRTFLSGR